MPELPSRASAEASRQAAQALRALKRSNRTHQLVEDLEEYGPGADVRMTSPLDERDQCVRWQYEGLIALAVTTAAASSGESVRRRSSAPASCKQLAAARPR